MSTITQRQALQVFTQSDFPCPVHPLHHASSDQKRLLLVSVSAGNGHVRAAQAIAAHAWRDFPQLRLQHIDMMQIVPTLFRKLYSDLYMKIASGLPEAWGWLYRKTDREPDHRLSGRLRRAIQRLCSQRLFEEIDRFKPNVIICTHFLPAEVLASAITEKRLDCQVWVQVTDFDLHQMWLHPGISGYFVANEELAFRLQCQGVPRKDIVVSGIPVMPVFTTRPDRPEAAARLSLNPDCFTVLLMGGGAGIGMDPVWITELLETESQLQVIVMTGKNQALRKALVGVAHEYSNRLRIIGFTEDVATLMMAADLAITKPGGLSTSECLVCGLPMLLVNPIPGQEERNAAFLLQEGVAVRADDPLTLQFRLQKLLSDPARLDSMRQRAIALSKPEAAHQVLERIA
ncbi:MAG: galactosyldiacylglycerol synthase [Oxalobacteraceae bacterium]|nr:galactosyldiacylglycerol synthase [Oxalobacteraceae bacterium]